MIHYERVFFAHVQNTSIIYLMKRQFHYNSATKSVNNICATKTDRYIFGRLPHIYQSSAKLEKQVYTFQATSTT